MQTIVHESEHVAQYAALGTDYVSLSSAEANQLYKNNDGYIYGNSMDQGVAFWDLNVEQQAMVAQDLYNLDHNQAPQGAGQTHHTADQLRAYMEQGFGNDQPMD